MKWPLGMVYQLLICHALDEIVLVCTPVGASQPLLQASFRKLVCADLQRGNADLAICHGMQPKGE